MSVEPFAMRNLAQIGEIFRGNDLAVRDATLPDDNSVVVVTFPARTARQGLDRKGFGQDYLRSKKVSAIHITAAWNHWFQTAELASALSAINAVTGRFGRVVTYGSSMGGYGALLTGARLRANAVIAISPQISIDRLKVPFERRWATDAIKIDFRDDCMATSIIGVPDISLFYDPRSSDRIHAERIEALDAQVALVPIPFGGHPAGAFLRDAKILSTVIGGLISGTMYQKQVRQLVRGARRDTALYWANLAGGLRSRNPAVALEAINRAVVLDPADPAIQFSHGKLLARSGAQMEASRAFSAAAQAKPSVAKYHLEHGLALLRVGHHEEASNALVKAVALDESSTRAWQGLAAAYRVLRRTADHQEALSRSMSASAFDERIA